MEGEGQVLRRLQLTSFMHLAPHRHSVIAFLLGLLSLSAVLSCSSSRGQGPNRSASKFYPDSSDTAEALLRNAASHARDGQWSETIAIYQRIIDQYGDKVAKLPRNQPPGEAAPSDEFILYVDLRAYCHRSLAKLPEEARALYRSRMDGQAGRWYQEGLGRRDTALLRKVVELAFCSSWGDDALELLGDLAFQEGHFGEALSRYRQLVPDREPDGFSLIHPDPSVDLARIAAKKLLCRAAAGEEIAATELQKFADRFPEASGTLAGRKGSYAKTLQESLSSDHLAPEKQPDSRWPTFAGALSRTKIASETVDVGSLQWKVSLERISPGRNPYAYNGRSMTTNTPNSSQERLLGYHPIVLGDQVIVADGTRVVAYNLNDRPGGKAGSMPQAIEPAWKHDPDQSIPKAFNSGTGIPRYTLTAVGSRIYARMGTSTPPVIMNAGRGRGMASSYIVALDWTSQGKLLWLQRASELNLPNRQPERFNPRICFEGTPVADRRNVYVAVTDRRELTATYVACFDAETGSSRWVRYLGAASSELDNFMAMGMGLPRQAPGDYGHQLLSLEGPYLYYQTNLGAVVALEAETGSVCWVATYPRQDTGRMAGSDRDLNPAIVHEGRVIVAPSDSSSIYAFDATSGRLLWKTEPIADEIRLTHLLGVAQGHLVATGDRVLLFDVENGNLVSTWPDSGKVQGYGRGLLAGNRIYWPTRDRIEVLDQRKGQRAEPPIKLLETYRTTGGNLVAGDGYLIVAQPDAMVVFCQNSRLIERYREEIARNPEEAATHYRLARAAEAVGQDEIALQAYEQSIRKAGKAEMVDGIALADAARDHKFRLLTRLAGEARKADKPDEAIARLKAASAVARSDRDRLSAQLLSAEVQRSANRPELAVRQLEELLSEDRLRSVTVSTEDGHRAIRSDLLVTDRLWSLVKEHGRAVYEPYDRRSRALLSQGLKERDPRLLDEVSRLYPVAEVVPDALLALGEMQQAAGRSLEAARSYKRLLAIVPLDDRSKARALWRLAHIYLEQNYLVLARDAYLRILASHAGLRLDEAGTDASLGELVSAELSRPPLAQLAQERPRPPIVLPLTRNWHVRSPAGRSSRLLSAEGLPPWTESSRVFMTEGTKLLPLDPRSGEPRWTADLGAPITWVGYLTDRLVAATPHRVFCLDLPSGGEQWRFARGETGPSQRAADPFARTDPADNQNESARDLLHDFQAVGRHLFCLRGDQELIALDGDTGIVDWSYSAGGGEINPKLWIGPERIVLQVLRPNQILVLETENGRPMARVPLNEGQGLQRVPVPIDADHVLIVPDRRTVKKLDLSRGLFTWDYRESVEMPVNGPPRVMVEAERLMMLHDGHLLIRLDPVNGSRIWSAMLATEDLSERPDAIVCDEQRIYCVTRQTLRAIAMDSGQTVWSCHLTGPENAQWSVKLSDRYVMAYPTLSSASDEEIESMPVVVRRQDTGALVQRFIFPATIADVTLRLNTQGALLATPHSLWTLSRREVTPSREPAPLP
jgi:outer membrane protein assembly factor BamB